MERTKCSSFCKEERIVFRGIRTEEYTAGRFENRNVYPELN